MKKILALLFALSLSACASIQDLQTASVEGCVEPNRQSYHAADLDAQWYVCETGDIKWPPNDGFDGAPKKETLAKGTLIDRYSGFPPDQDGGKYFSPAGTSFEARALPYNVDTQTLTTYRVVKPFEVEGGKVEGWFGEPGGGTQYRSPTATKDLLRDGFIVVAN